MTKYTWMCPTELDRERLVTTVHGVGRARVIMFGVLLAIVIGSSRQTGWWPLVLVLVAGVASVFLYRNLDRRRVPEYWAAAGWLATQLPLGVGIAVTGGSQSPALPWLSIAVVSLVARFNRIAIRIGMVFIYLVLLADTVAVDPTWTLRHPGNALGTAGLLFSVWIFAEALMRSDLDQRTHDKVTGLPNHAKFVDDLHLALSRREHRGGTITVLAAHLDGFGLVMENLGPRAGHALLSQAGARIAHAASASSVVARSSTNEFLILLSDLGEPAPGPAEPWNTPEQRAREVADSICAALKDAIDVREREIYLTACVGIAILGQQEDDEDHEDTGERLLSGAEFALSSAHSAGPGSIAVYDGNEQRSERHLSVVTKLRKAIEQGALELHYQPTVDLHTGTIQGVEALARWQDEELGQVPPCEFIAVAEETGLIEPLGDWVLEEVAQQARAWEAEGMKFEIAFNVSPRQLWQPQLLPRMQASLAAAGVPLERFVVEITESSTLRDFDSTVARLGAMRAEGFRIAIDDFGVDLSSLSRLLEIPSDVLKIDRSFVSALSKVPNAGVMVQTIIQLAERLGMRAHAEGVETDEERRFLVANGCAYGQGYLFSKAVPAHSLRTYYMDSLYTELTPQTRPPIRRVA